MNKTNNVEVWGCVFQGKEPNSFYCYDPAGETAAWRKDGITLFFFLNGTPKLGGEINLSNYGFGLLAGELATLKAFGKCKVRISDSSEDVAWGTLEGLGQYEKLLDTAGLIESFRERYFQATKQPENVSQASSLRSSDDEVAGESKRISCSIL